MDKFYTPKFRPKMRAPAFARLASTLLLNSLIVYGLLLTGSLEAKNNEKNEATSPSVIIFRSTSQPKAIVLKAKSCALIEKQLQAINQWRTKLNENPVELRSATAYKMSDEESAGVYRCAHIVNAIIPAKILPLLSIKISYNGPNCWNSALVINNILPFYRYSTEDEMSFWLSSPYCKAIGPQEGAAPGDVVAIRRANSNNSKLEEVHAFTYLTDELSFSKNGANRVKGFELLSFDKILSTYYTVPTKKPICRKSPHQPTQELNQCSEITHFFRCRSAASDIQEMLRVEGDYKKSYDKIVSIENYVSQWALRSSLNAQSYVQDQAFIDLSQMEGQINAQINMLQILLKKPYSNNKNWFFWMDLKYRVEATLLQVEMF